MAQLASNEEDAVRVAVLRVGRNGFLVVAEEGDFPCTGPWHCEGWVDDYMRYYYFGCLIIWIPLMSGSSIIRVFLVLGVF